ncbi:MAG TPA: hypothetical protein VFI69_05355 [Candidatus Limnocylindrales bacterium]|jgi:hypothetical protein|nr:hypothetical protein [Candidatus Limnocylindrales bacterium]
MPIRVDAYIDGGVASGILARSGHLRDVLEADRELVLERVRWQPLDGPDAPMPSELTIPIDDLFIAVADDDPSIPVHASWHAIRLEIGPYLVEGDMPTLPGFDPGRALTRPTGEFVMLRDVRIGRLDDAAGAAPAPTGHHALINRYVVERVEADLMLGFFFPGASMPEPDPVPVSTDPTPAAASSPTADRPATPA